MMAYTAKSSKANQSVQFGSSLKLPGVRFGRKRTVDNLEGEEHSPVAPRSFVHGFWPLRLAFVPQVCFDEVIPNLIYVLLECMARQNTSGNSDLRYHSIA
jgi:hypothetical protein